MKTCSRIALTVLIALILLLSTACNMPTSPTAEVAGNSPQATPASAHPAGNPKPAPGEGGTLSGYVGYLNFPTPASVLYAIDVADPASFYVLELPGSNALLEFELQVKPGTYQLIAWAQDGSMVASLRTAEPVIGTVIVAVGETVSELLLGYVAPETPCQLTAVPASPDGRFPATLPAAGCVFSTPTAEAAATVPSRPGDLQFFFVCTVDTATTTLNWVDTSNNETGFQLYRNGVLLVTLPANTTSYVDVAPATRGTSFLYRLVAYNAVGESAARTASYTCP